MPSIRIKRSYSTIQEDPDDQHFLAPPPRLPRRSISWSQLYKQPDSSDPLAQALEKDSQPPTRPRSNTVGGGPPRPTLNQNASPGTPRLGARVPSRVRQHILNSARVPRIQSPLVERNDDSFLAQARRSISSLSHRSDRSDMISLEGYQENILIPADPGHEPGRISQAFSNQSSQHDDPFEEHHHDDIVEHLDVIGMSKNMPSNIIHHLQLL